MIKLYELAGKDSSIRFSPYVWRVRLSLLHKGLPFDGIAVQFTDKTAFAAAQSRTVPVINAGDLWVADSFDICVHLDEHHQGKKLIGDVTTAKFFNNWLDTVVVRGLFPMIACDVWTILTPQDQEYFRSSREKYLGCTLEEARDARQGATADFLKALAPARNMLKQSDNKFLSGDEAGWCDYALAGNFIWARIISDYDVLKGDAILSQWMERMLDLFDGHARKAPRVHG